jgi:hypothetical protein
MEPDDSARHPLVSAQIAAYVDELGARIDWSLPVKKRCEVTMLQYNQLLWSGGGAWNAVVREVAATGTPEGVGVEVARNAVANAVAWECIARHKGEYAQFVAEHFIQLYRYSNSVVGRSYVGPMETSIAPEHRGVAPAGSHVREAAPESLIPVLDLCRALPDRLVLNWRWILLATAVLPIIVLVRGRRSPSWMVLPAMAFSMTGLYLAGTAFYQVALHRYILPIQLIHCLGNVVLIAGIAGSIVAHVARRRASVPTTESAAQE